MVRMAAPSLFGSLLKRLTAAVLFALFLGHFFAFGGEFPLPSEDIPRYEIALDIDFAEGAFRGMQTIGYLNATGERLEEIFLRLYPNAPAIFGNGFLNVEEVRVDGEPIETRAYVGNTVLWVPLPSPLDHGEWIFLELQFDGRTATWEEGSSSSVGYGIYATSPRTMTLATFYPILAVYDEEGWNIDPIAEIGDAVSSDVGTYTVEVTVDPDLTLLTSGRRVDQWDEGDRRVYRFIGEGMRDFAVVVGKGYSERSAIVGDVTLRTNFFPEHAQAGEVAMARVEEAIDLYQQCFGPFAFDELDLVEVPLARAAGVEYPGLILIAESYSVSPSNRFFDIIIAHEAAHQWWYAVVGSDVIEEPWLDEALATYSSALFLEETVGIAVAREVATEWEAAYRSVNARYPELSVASPVYRFPDSATYSAFVYSGGAVFLDAVREAIGDAAFFDALAGYYSDHAFQIAHSVDLLAHFEQACGCTLSDIFSQYLEP